MVVVIFGVVAALTLWHAVPSPSPSPARCPPIARSPATAELYSLRARRRFATYLRLRLLDWREEGLERAAAVVEGRLPVDALVPAKPAPPDQPPPSAKHSPLEREERARDATPKSK